MIEKILLKLGYKKYICTDCKKVNYKKDDNRFAAINGFCWFCQHPLFKEIKDTRKIEKLHNTKQKARQGNESKLAICYD